ncbi:ATPase [Pseudoxanthomonas broegbernensis]|uniref:ATPase n=2 Tax=Pseudoxanthomonas broegbernensis TaxID=83619 RepID=A0A7V8GQ78_9GAMM|nr:ATPase [Pseudoxanthomonas broegbernensis]
MNYAIPPFADNAAFLEALCHYADLLIDRALSRRQAVSMSKTPGSTAARQVSLREQHARELDVVLQTNWRQLDDRMQATLAHDCFIPWIHLAQLFQLTPLEQQVVLIALLPDIDPEYRGILAELSDGEAVAEPDLPLSVVAHLLGVPFALQASFLADGALRHWRLLEIGPQCDVLRLRGAFHIDATLAAYLSGRAVPQLRLYEALPELPAADMLETLQVDDSSRQLAERFVQRCGAGAPQDAAFLLQLQGPDARMLERLCAAIFTPLRMGCARLDCGLLTGRAAGEGRAAMLDRLRQLCRDALLCNRVLVLVDCHRMSGNAVDDETQALFSATLDTLMESQRYVVAINGPARVLSEHAHRFTRHRMTPLTIQVPMPDAALRRSLWQVGAKQQAIDVSEALLGKLVNSYLFTQSQIDSVLKEAASRRVLDGGDSAPETLLIDACRDASVTEQFSVAEEVKTRYRLDDIVLPEPTRGWLEEVLQYATHRHRVIEDWGFDRHNPNSRNLCVLFYGPSGTGKTMAASIVANELNLGLYRVDLAGVMSKYIGETEKHLAQLFDQAESMNVVLYFDEAESLFSKRTETHDAHDRYANIQTGYLLQRIETYPGIVILSTNMLKNLDQAFTRRFKFMIEYPFPGAAQRRQLWHKAFPPDAPLAADLDFELLAAKAALSGGNINNIALRAAFYAAAGQRAVGMEDVMRALEREYDKLGKVFAPADFVLTETE